MAIVFACDCGKSLKVPDELAGRKAKCPHCGTTVRVPSDAMAEVTAITVETPPPSRNLPPPLPAAEPPALPPEDEPLTTHAGEPIDERDDFFASTPPEIGRLVSASTTLRVDKEALPTLARIAILLFVTAAAGVLGLTAGVLLIDRNPVAIVLYILVPAAATFAGTYFFTRFRHTCQYVGEEGLASFVCVGSRENVVRSDIFLFDQADTLRTAQTRNYYNGAYTGTNYNFAWSDTRGRKLHTLTGTYRGEKELPKPTSPFHFALRAETAWTLYLFRNLDKITTADKTLFFPLGGKNSYVEIENQDLVMCVNGAVTRFPAGRIARARLVDGKVSLWEQGGKEGWFSSKGVHTFPYQDLGNGRFFFYALQKLLGIPVVD